MLFNSIVFFLYLPIVFVVYWLLSAKVKLQNAFVILASYVFYGWWSWKFLILIAITTFCSFISGIGIESASKKAVRRLILWANISINLGILVVYKYYDFFVSNIQALLSNVGITMDDVTLKLILPVGISFYTFQALSYSIDVYRGKIKLTRDALAFFAFISFFPQLVAGPIERATNLLPQFLKRRRFNYEQAVDGCRQILWGFFKKIVIADNCASYVNEIFSSYVDCGGLNLWLGAICFSFQIYGDFSGYSDLAIGVSKLFNINLMNNFRTPYFSRDIAEFWRRWHISLTTWFRDYIYIPLGGSRVVKKKVARNTAIVFLVSGLWHGAEWTFLAWGAYHSILFMPLILSGKNRKYTEIQERGVPTFKETLLMGYTFILVAIGWVIFRAETLSSAFHYLKRMFTDFRFGGSIGFNKVLLLWFSLLFVVEWINRRKRHTFSISGNGLMKYRIYRWIVYLSLSFVCCYYASLSEVSGEFIYFQF